MDSSGGGWTVFQRRMDGTVNFYRPWDYYKFGFGDPAGEYYLGLDNIHYLTKQRHYGLRVNKHFARYSSFSVNAECDGYKLQVSEFINGGAGEFETFHQGDALTYHNGQKFSTFDKDQDPDSRNCARLYLGAFWYNECHNANPTEVYRWGADGTIFAVGVSWYQWKGHDYFLKSISMKIRPVQ